MKGTYIQSIKEIIGWRFVLLEQLQVLEHSLLYRYLIEVANAVLTQEVKLHHISAIIRYRFLIRLQ